MKRTDSPIDVVYNAGRLGLRGAITNLWVGGPPHVNLMNNRFSRTPPLAGER